MMYSHLMNQPESVEAQLEALDDKIEELIKNVVLVAFECCSNNF